MAIPFLSLICGILTAFSGMDIWLGVVAIILGTIAYFYILSLKKSLLRYYRFSTFHKGWIVLWFIGIGNISGNFSIYNVPDDENLKNIRAVEGYVVDITDRANGDIINVECINLYYPGEIHKDHYRFNTLIYSDACSFKPGDKIIFSGESLRRIKDSENSFKGGYAKMMNRRGYFFTSFNPASEIIKSGERFSLKRVAVDIRDKIIGELEKVNLEKDTRFFLITILTGEKANLNPDTRDLFSDAGVAHILALSGLHIGILGGIVLFLLFPLNFFGKYKIRYLITVIILWFYTFVMGAAPSLVRACVMVSVFSIAMILERKNTSLNSLCLAGFIILLFSPLSIYDIGFQLSFICVGALIILGNHLNPVDYRRHPRLHNLCALILASMIATFVSWILVAYYFHRVPTMFLPSNVILLPILPFYILLSLIFFSFCLMGLEIGFLGQFIDKSFKLAKELLDYFGSGFTISISVTEWPMIIWYAGCAILTVYIVKWKKKTLLALATLFFVSSILLILNSPSEYPKGIIICNKHKEISLVVSNGKEETIISCPRSASSLHRIESVNILVIDQDTVAPDLYTPSLSPDYILIGGAYKGEASAVASINREATFITHPSIQKDRESKLLEEADSLFKHTHSIRKDQAFKILF